MATNAELITSQRTSRRRNAVASFFSGALVVLLINVHGPILTTSLSPSPMTASPCPRVVMVGPTMSGGQAHWNLDVPPHCPLGGRFRDHRPLRVGTVVTVGRGRRPTLVPLLASGVPSGNSGGTSTKDSKDDALVDMSSVEREVVESAQSRLDWRAVRSAIGLEDRPSSSLHSEVASSASGAESSKGGSSSLSAPSGIETREKEEVSSLSGVVGFGGAGWKVALSSGAACFFLSYLLLHSYVLSGVVFVAVVFLASRDPLEEDGAAGAAARIIGRTTLRSIEASRPKVRAVARAAVGDVDSEIRDLRSRVAHLEEENARLLTWIERRKAVDEALSRYTLGELKGLAREGGLTVGGTKAQLLMRLVESEMVVLE